jgi:anti-sigma regulatory factor (Ser/Thr protein kinase)
MATVELLFSALPEHVRTARLVAAAVARRAGVDEAVLDEVRLAVGEACSRAVGMHRTNGIDAPVAVRLTEEEKSFSIEVGDGVTSGHGGATTGHDGGGDDAEDESRMGLAVISGLVDDIEVTTGPDGGTIRMTWPVAADV